MEEVFYFDPLKVTVREGLERYRKDLGDLAEFGDSLKEVGQIQPIVINRKNELIVGGRRLAACILKGMKVKTIYEDLVNSTDMRLWELEENLKRKALTPAEEVLAIEELHRIEQLKHGESVSGREGGHTLDDTAKILGKTRGSVIDSLEMAQMVRAFPELKGATKKSEIKKAARGLSRISEAMEGLKAIKGLKSERFKLHNMDAVEHMRSLPNGCKDILLTDPPYGIDADKVAMTVGGRTGGALTSTGFTLDDNAERALMLLNVLAKESFRFTTSKAHGYVFVGPEHFWMLRYIFMEVGWKVHIKPLIWTKGTSGQCNVPSAWPSSCYEMLMYIRKDESKIVKEGQPDWMECSPVLDKLHPYEKPVPLLLNLLERVCIPGQQLYDPFMGCGSNIEAGLEMKLICEGVDNSLEAYSIALKRVKECIGNRNDNENKRIYR